MKIALLINIQEGIVNFKNFSKEVRNDSKTKFLTLNEVEIDDRLKDKAYDGGLLVSQRRINKGNKTSCRVSNEILPFVVYVEKFDSSNGKMKLSAKELTL